MKDIITKKTNNNYITLGHHIGRIGYDLCYWAFRKIKGKGVIPTLFLTYTSISIATKMLLPPYIKPSATCVLATGFYIMSYWWLKTKTCDYYNTMFKLCGVYKNHVGLVFKRKYINKNENLVYVFKSNVSIETLKKESDVIGGVLKAYIIDIRFNKRNVEIVTSDSPIDYKDMAKNGNTIGMKIYAALRVLNIDSDNFSEINDSFKDSTAFNCSITKKEMEKIIPEIEHITNLENIKLFSDKFFDFRMTVKKKVGSFDFKDLLLNTKIKKDNIIIGMNDSGLITVNFKKKYHWLIAGSTGFGKSNESHVIISSALQTAEDTAFFLLDPKKSELKRYRDIDRVYYSGDRDEIMEALRKLKKEMDRRNELIEDEKFINDIDSWNDDKNKTEKFGYIFIYIEEMAQLMLDPDKEFVSELTNILVKLLSLSRSAGFRFFFTTQYPKKEVVPTLVKNCLINRLGFLVSNVIESNVIMDSTCLTELKDIGEMKFKNNGRILDVKAPFLKKADIIPIVCHLEERHSKFPSKPHILNIVTVVPNAENTRATTLSIDPEAKNATQKELYKVLNKNDLLRFYIENCDNKVYSLNKTVEMITLGRTKTQEYRKELIENGDLEKINGETYINKRHTLKRIK